MKQENVMMAFEAFLEVAKKQGIDIKSIAGEAHIGIMGNDLSFHPSADDKPQIIEALKTAIKIVG